MKLLLFTLLLSTQVSAQIKIPKDSFDKKAAGQVLQNPGTSEPFICRIPEILPEFPGGEVALHQYLANNLIYPDIAIKNNIQGKVLVRFIIKEDGSISNATIVRPLGYGLDEEALRLIQSMPEWKTGRVNGKIVPVPFQIPVKFVLP